MSSSIRKAQMNSAAYTARDPSERATYRKMMKALNADRRAAPDAATMLDHDLAVNAYLAAMYAMHGGNATRYQPFAAWRAANAT